MLSFPAKAASIRHMIGTSFGLWARRGRRHVTHFVPRCLFIVFLFEARSQLVVLHDIQGYWESILTCPSGFGIRAKIALEIIWSLTPPDCCVLIYKGYMISIRNSNSLRSVGNKIFKKYIRIYAAYCKFEPSTFLKYGIKLNSSYI